MTFDLDISHTGSTRHYIGHVRKTELKIVGQSSRSQEENVAKAVGATSSEGFLAARKICLTATQHLWLACTASPST